MKKTVAKPINVPDSDYCWEPEPPREICEWFDNEGGYPVCDQGLGILSHEETGGVRKCEACRKLPLANCSSDGDTPETEEIERLRQWKKEAIQVLTSWDRVWEAAGSPGTLGQSKSDAVLKFIQNQNQV